MSELFVVVSAATGDPLWAAVTDQETAQDAAVRIAVNSGNCNMLNGRDLAEHLADRAPKPTADDVDYRPTTSCGCGYELVWVCGYWQHNASPELWGDDHDANEPAPTGAARERWDQEDGVVDEYTCRACGRPEGDCSKDPCDTVIKERES